MDKIKGGVNVRIDGVRDKLLGKDDDQQVVAGIGDQVQDQIDTRQDRMDKIKGGVNGRIDGVRDKLLGKDDDQQVVAGIGDQVQDRIDTRHDRMNNMKDRIKDRVHDIRDRVKDGVDDVHDKVKDGVDGVHDRVKDRVDGVHDRVHDIRDRVKDGVDYVHDRVKDRVDGVHDRVKDRMDGVHDRVHDIRDRVKDGVDYVHDRVKDRVDGVRDRVTDRLDDVHDRIHDRMDNVFEKVGNARDRIRDRVDSIEENVRDRLEKVREKINKRLDKVHGKVKDEVKDRVKDRLDHVRDRLKDRLDDIREELEEIKPFKRDCSASLVTMEVPVMDDDLECPSNNSVTFDITDTDNYFLVLENFFYYGVNKVDLQIRLDRSVYELPEDTMVCSNTKKCTVPLLFKSQQKPMVQMAAPPVTQHDDDAEDTGVDTAKVVTVCKARVSFFFLLFAAVPVVILIGVGFCIGVLCTCRGKTRMYTYIQRMDSEDYSKTPLLKRYTATYSNGTSKQSISSVNDEEIPPPPYFPASNP